MKRGCRGTRVPCLLRQPYIGCEWPISRSARTCEPVIENRNSARARTCDQLERTSPMETLVPPVVPPASRRQLGEQTNRHPNADKTATHILSNPDNLAGTPATRL